MILRIDHVSIAVKDYEKAHNFFSELLEIVPGAAGSMDSLGFFFRVYSAGDLSRLELISPTGENSFLDGFLSQRDGGVHHITFQVKDIREARRILDRKKIPYFGYSEQHENWKELFIHPKHAFGVLIQLAEFCPEEWLDESQNLPAGRKWSINRSNDDITLSIAHPGGGKVELNLEQNEIKALINDLSRYVK